MIHSRIPSLRATARAFSPSLSGSICGGRTAAVHHPGVPRVLPPHPRGSAAADCLEYYFAHTGSISTKLIALRQAFATNDFRINHFRTAAISRRQLRSTEGLVLEFSKVLYRWPTSLDQDLLAMRYLLGALDRIGEERSGKAFARFRHFPQLLIPAVDTGCTSPPRASIGEATALPPAPASQFCLPLRSGLSVAGQLRLSALHQA